jgi:hypothetical protein
MRSLLSPNLTVVSEYGFYMRVETVIVLTEVRWGIGSDSVQRFLERKDKG